MGVTGKRVEKSGIGGRARTMAGAGPTYLLYLESRGRNPRLLVVVGTRQDSGTGHQGPDLHAVPVGVHEAACHESDLAGEEQPAGEEQEQGPPEVSDEVDVKAHVEAALARIMAASAPPPATEAIEEEDQRRQVREHAR